MDAPRGSVVLGRTVRALRAGLLTSRAVELHVLLLPLVGGIERGFYHRPEILHSLGDEGFEPFRNCAVGLAGLWVIRVHRGFQMGLALRLEPYLQVLPSLAAQDP